MGNLFEKTSPARNNLITTKTTLISSLNNNLPAVVPCAFIN